ncbi:MAG TPA: cupin domain-containing protein [Acidimicrobiales bacterium]|mgnify:CR=1 FL=1
MSDLSGVLRRAAGDGVQWTLEGDGELHVNLVHLDPGHAIGDHVNDGVDVVFVVLAGTGQLTVDGAPTRLAPHVVAHVPKGARRSIRADGDDDNGDDTSATDAAPRGLNYLTIHCRPRPLGIGPARRRPEAEPAAEEGGVPAEEGGDPACWLHLLEPDDDGVT